MTESFYNDIAPYYKLLFPDWEASVFRHASALDGVIREVFGPSAHTILDAARGIGTQSLGLAQLGYQVTASDISAAAVEPVYPQPFDVVLACDNAVPRLLQAFQQFYRCTAPGAGCLISVRDYAQMEKGGRRNAPRLSHITEGRKTILFDLWEFNL